VSTRPTTGEIAVAITSSSSSHYVETKDIDLSKIKVPERLRSLQPEKVEAMIGSIKETGLINPISVRSSSDGDGYELVAGNHRLEAARELGYVSILATVQDLTPDQALLAEIDENLMRAELSPAEVAEHTIKRKEIYERLHPETKQGGDHRSPEFKNGSENPAFVDDTAKKTGKGRSTVARNAQRGKNIPNIRKVKGTSLNTGVELDALAQLPPAEQDAIIELAMSGKPVSAKKTLKNKSPAARQRTPTATSKLSMDFQIRLERLEETMDELSRAGNEAWQRALGSYGKDKVQDVVTRLRNALNGDGLQ
jgi:uncharacterized ParB-like nuclease family protein